MSRPLRREDLAAVPEGFRAGAPDFVGIATPKAGTSWWWSLIERHPQVVANRLRTKELHHFRHFGFDGPSDRDVEVYRSAFVRGSGSVCGEWTPSYAGHPLAIDWLHAAAPDARILAIVRNPVDAVLSAFNMKLQRRAGLLAATREHERFYRDISLFPESFQVVQVATGLRRALELFGPDRVLVLQYERLVRRTPAELARTYAFLGLDPRYRPPRAHAPVNRLPYVLEVADDGLRGRLAAAFLREVEALLELGVGLEGYLWPDYSLG